MTTFSATDSGVKTIEHRWIEMPDGVRLAARIWMPPGRLPGPYPALLEYIPYRKRDLVRARDERNHPFFAAHGYVCLRVDMRGSGDSEGHMADMYSDHELSDARQVIAWIAAQPWCCGRVGMFGTSWGGTASLQAAVDAPAALRAVLANCATTDRFDDDIHYMGGCLLTDSIEWGATLPAILAAPPDEASVGPEWRRIWSERLQHLSFPLENWVREKTRGRYWRHGSVRFAYQQLACPILAVGGWSDRYSNSVIPLISARPDICWGIVGPWGHHYPDQGEPGPAMGFQALALAWWDHWLKTPDPVALGWPKLRLWRREFDPPRNRLTARSGTWIEIDDGLIAGKTQRFFASRNTLLGAPAGAEQGIALRVPFDTAHGGRAGDTGYFGRVGGLPLEQSADDDRALCFDSAPLVGPVDLLGSATLAVEIARHAQQAQLVCRLCDVAPDGQSCLVTRTVYNLELDPCGDTLAPFYDNRRTRIVIRFPTTAYRFRHGHRLRLSLAASYWPLIWPVPADPSIRAFTASAELSLPTEPEAARALSVALPTAVTLPQTPTWTVIEAGELARTQAFRRDGLLHSSWQQTPVAVEFADTSTTLRVETSVSYRLAGQDAERARCAVRYRLTLERPDGIADVLSEVTVESSHLTIKLRGHLLVHWQDETLAEKRWRYDLPR